MLCLGMAFQDQAVLLLAAFSLQLPQLFLATGFCFAARSLQPIISLAYLKLPFSATPVAWNSLNFSWHTRICSGAPCPRLQAYLWSVLSLTFYIPTWWNHKPSSPASGPWSFRSGLLYQLFENRRIIFK